MSINIKCKKCGETGIRKDQDELAKSNKCKVCGGLLEIQKGSVMEIPMEAIVKTGMGMAKDLIGKKQKDNREHLNTIFDRMAKTLEAILVEQIKHTEILNKWKDQDKEYHDKQLDKMGGS